MIKTTPMLLDELSKYAAPANKLQRMVRAGEITPIVRGLYETDPHTDGRLLAGSIYGPSYLSFEYALAYHGLIPEGARCFTCATFEKHKSKHYATSFGRFAYCDVPSVVFPLGIDVRREGPYAYRIACPEKALCDKLYTIRPVRNTSELADLLFQHLRIDEDAFSKLDTAFIFALQERYRSTNIRHLCSYIKKMQRRAQ